MLELEWPWILIALPLPLLVYRFIKPASSGNDAALYTPFYGKLSSMMGEQNAEPKAPAGKRILLPGLIWILLLFAASKPVWLGDPVEVQDSGRDLMMAVDLSGSMEINDMVLNGRQVDRLSATKAVMNDFIERRRGDRLGLILFGTRAYLQTPLTFDRETVRTLMNESGIGMAGNQTAIGDALGLAVKHLRKRPEDSRVLILLTDGANTAGEISPLQAAQIAKEEGIKIYAIGLGAEEMVERSFFGSRRVNPSADLDEHTLQEMAGLTGGQYFRARNIEELNNIYTLLDQLEPVAQENELFRPSRNLFFWPLGLALLLSLIPAIMNIYLPGTLCAWKTDKGRNRHD
ncbi:VWA domain-containing protein [Endozoicomonas sp. SCSIO W0465]|uniref:vWA domain-containing protein n=1 Tax=Endozoicomonas sp. SCSIO W0465 TaxID=2918516 RepID=UPI0020754217|nr:VWA domain-containing protein [Endozoicomonas sp. SCSIO W0465]USE34275.1 VWA domain-containing protein [Endozoicomonas sp. SCSIO W0465]